MGHCSDFPCLLIIISGVFFQVSVPQDPNEFHTLQLVDMPVPTISLIPCGVICHDFCPLGVLYAASSGAWSESAPTVPAHLASRRPCWGLLGGPADSLGCGRLHPLPWCATSPGLSLVVLSAPCAFQSWIPLLYASVVKIIDSLAYLKKQTSFLSTVS